MTSLTIIADFTVEPLVLKLRGKSPGALDIEVAPPGRIEQKLASYHQKSLEARRCAFVWTLPEQACPSFELRLRGEHCSDATVLAEVDAYCDRIVAAAGAFAALFIATWTQPAYRRGLGLLDMRPDLGTRALLLRMNARLIERIAHVKNAYALDADRWRQAAASDFNARLWYAAKIAVSNDVFDQAADDLLAALDGIRGASRKLVILDLDNTLWGGTVGDLGWENLTLGGHHAAGEAYVDFQRELKTLASRGVLLAVVSKNDETVALGAIDNHPEMLLRRDDFVAWRINWNDKAANIVDLVEGLNLGLQSVVFIDDNPAERGRVRETLPEVLVPDWPENPLLFVEAFAKLRCFDVASLTEEDRTRAASYHAEARRERSRTALGSAEEWLASMQLVVSAAPLGAGNAVRVVQLLNKTNQMNLAGRRLTDVELKRWLDAGSRTLVAFDVADRFGSYGLTGLLTLDIRDDDAEIVDFVLSCRVFSRGVEQTMLAVAADIARKAGSKRISAAFRPTGKNLPTRRFLESESAMHLNQSKDGCEIFSASCDEPSMPPHVKLDDTAFANVAVQNNRRPPVGSRISILNRS